LQKLINNNKLKIKIMRNKFKFLDNDNNKLSLIIIDDNEHTAELERMDFSSKFNGELIMPSYVTYKGINYNITSIGKEAFKGRKRLTSITIPNSVTNIGDFAFEHCSSLTSITNMSINPQEIDSATFNKVPENVILYVPESSILKYLNSQWWKQFNNLNVIK
jgi:hypothetical protein